MAFTKSGFRDQNWSHLGGEQIVKREEERRKRKKRRGRRREAKIKPTRYGTTLSMDFVWITWNLRLDLVNLLSLNLGF